MGIGKNKMKILFANLSVSGNKEENKGMPNSYFYLASMLGKQKRLGLDRLPVELNERQSRILDLIYRNRKRNVFC